MYNNEDGPRLPYVVNSARKMDLMVGRVWDVNLDTNTDGVVIVSGTSTLALTIEQADILSALLFDAVDRHHVIEWEQELVDAFWRHRAKA